MKELSKARAILLEVGEEAVDQRLDNFLIRRLKGVPKSHVYRVVRSGEVRVNSGRSKADYRLRQGDRVRIPPLRLGAPTDRPAGHPHKLPVAYEDAALIVIDKPSGVAVHGGSGVSYGVIESLRALRPEEKFLELAHRLDRDTSGLLIVAKKRAALVELHRMFRDGEVKKIYLAVVQGAWQGAGRTLRERLHKFVTSSGERRVSVGEAGVEAATEVRPLAVTPDASLLELRLLTGRTHQIRVHLAHAGHPILGDDKYGEPRQKKTAAVAVSRRLPVSRRLLLHAGQLALRHPVSGKPLRLRSALPEDMRHVVAEHFPKHAGN